MTYKTVLPFESRNILILLKNFKTRLRGWIVMANRDEILKVLNEYMYPLQQKLNSRAKTVNEIHNNKYEKYAAINLYHDDIETQNKVIQLRFEKVAEPILQVRIRVK